MVTALLERTVTPTVEPKVLPGCLHLVTLRHPQTGDEQLLEVATLTNSFTEVYRQVCWMRAEMKLRGYQIFEVLEATPAF